MERDDGVPQAFHAGVSRSREIDHDSNLSAMVRPQSAKNDDWTVAMPECVVQQLRKDARIVPVGVEEQALEVIQDQKHSHARPLDACDNLTKKRIQRDGPARSQLVDYFFQRNAWPSCARGARADQSRCERGKRLVIDADRTDDFPRRLGRSQDRQHTGADQ